jgi:hypothetical protein
MLPTNKEAKQKYDACYSAKRTAMFEAAIAGPETKPASEMSLDAFGAFQWIPIGPNTLGSISIESLLHFCHLNCSSNRLNKATLRQFS